MQDTTIPTAEQVERAIVARFNATYRAREAYAYAEHTGGVLMLGDALDDACTWVAYFVVRPADVATMLAAGYEWDDPDACATVTAEDATTP